MKHLKLFILLLLVNCYSNQNIALDSILKKNNYTIGQKYPSLSLYHNNQPLAVLGLTKEELNTQGIDIGNLDPNGSYYDNMDIILEYFSSFNDFSIVVDGERGINAGLHYAIIKENEQIFEFSGSWLFDCEVTRKNKKELVNKLTSQLFPILTNKLVLKDGWEYSLNNNVLTEKWTVRSPKKDGSSFWSLDYSVTINPYAK